MIYRLLDPWFLLRLYGTICWTLACIVIAGILLEGVCLLFLWLADPTPMQPKTRPGNPVG